MNKGVMHTSKKTKRGTTVLDYIGTVINKTSLQS